MSRGLRVKCITKEIRQLQTKLENDKANERVDQHPMLKPHEVKDDYWTPKPIPKPYFMDRLVTVIIDAKLCDNRNIVRTTCASSNRDTLVTCHDRVTTLPRV